MKLTNALKDTIILAVMQDTPEQFTFDQYNDDAIKIAVRSLPSNVAAVYSDNTTKGYIKLAYYNGIHIPSAEGVPHPEIDELRKKYNASEQSRYELRQHVRNVVRQFTTDTQMVKAIPELEKYLPKQPEKVANLPATQLVADLVKAGWPKSSK